MSEVFLTIADGGKITGIYSDDLADLMAEGKSTTTRASNVEPADGGWKATMRDGTVLGPFPLRGSALAAEVEYLKGVLAA